MSVIDIEGGGFVKLIDFMGGDLRTVNSARISFHKQKEIIDMNDVKLIKYLGAHAHTAPFRSTYVTLHFKAPIAIARQAMKHLIGSDYSFKDTCWNEVSGRYTDTVADECFIPTTLRGQAVNNKQGSEGIIDDPHLLEVYRDAIAKSTEAYNILINHGVAKEQARFLLPGAAFTEWYWTASLQAVSHFYKLRIAPNAQPEIQCYADAVKQLVQPRAPLSWEALCYQTQ